MTLVPPRRKILTAVDKFVIPQRLHRESALVVILNLFQALASEFVGAASSRESISVFARTVPNV
jgi:hypothetical protein